MKIYSENKQRFIEIVSTSDDLANYQLHCFSIKVSTPEVHGYNKEVLFKLDTIDQFLKQIDVLEVNREGSCALESMSTDVCELTFRSLGRRGHLAVSIKLSSDISDIGGVFKYGLFTEFEIDPTSLPVILRDFSHLIAKQKGSLPKVCKD